GPLGSFRAASLFQSKPRPTRGGKAGVAPLKAGRVRGLAKERSDYLTPPVVPLKITSACVPPSPAPGCAAEFLLFVGAEGRLLFEVLARESAPAVGKPQITFPALEVGGQVCQPLALSSPEVAVLDSR